MSKTKAKELHDRFQDEVIVYGRYLSEQQIKLCVNICVDELIKEQDMWQNGQDKPVKFWQDVKTEIEKL